MIATLQIDLNEHKLMLNDSQTGLLQTWIESPLLDKRLEPLLDKTIIYLPPNDHFMPDDVFIGAGSMAKKRLGDNWREDLKGLANSDSIPELYQRCYELREPQMDYVLIKNSRGVRFSYERLLLPFRLDNGTPMIVNLSEMTRFCHVTGHQPSHENLPGPSDQPHIGSLLGWEEPPSSGPVLSV